MEDANKSVTVLLPKETHVVPKLLLCLRFVSKGSVSHVGVTEIEKTVIILTVLSILM